MKSTLEIWKEKREKADLHLFRKFQILKKSELEQIREDWKVLRRIGLNKINQYLNDLGNKGQLLGMDVSDDAIYPYLEKTQAEQFFEYSVILEFSMGFLPVNMILIKSSYLWS